jgi:hypothetical protein
MEDLQAAIEALQRAREAKAAELQAIDHALEALRGSASSGPKPVEDRQTIKKFKHMGIVAAARRYLAEQGEPRTTREIADALTDGGVETHSKNYIATVYATLNNTAHFERKGGQWHLVE